MPITPTKFNADGTFEVRHDERNHSGQVNLADCSFRTALNGTVDQSQLIVPCPVGGCNSHSLWPVGGGSDPEMGQRLFVHALRARAAGRTWLQALAIQRTLVQTRDGGPDRWRLAGVDSEDQ
jgi:hypothetical protein